MRGVFLDRDGVINRYRRDYVRVIADFAYYDFAAEAFRILGATGLPLAVVTNQSGIGREYTTAAIVAEIHERLQRDAEAWGGALTAVEHCPHSPALEECDCRKPGSALFERISRDSGITLEGSYMVGDSPSDIEAGARLSMRTIRVATGRGDEPGPEPWRRAANLLEAARLIALEEEAREEGTASE